MTLRVRLRAASVGVLVVAGLIAAPAAVRAAETLDQQVPADTTFEVLVTDSGKWSQTFTAGLTGGLTKVEIYVAQTAGDDAPLNIQIRPVSASGAPTDTVLAAAQIPAAQISGLPRTFTGATFTPPVKVVAGTQYAIVASAVSDGPFFNWSGSNTNPYPGGKTWFFEPGTGTWAATNASFDLAFKTFVDPAPPFDAACDADGVKAGFNVIKGTAGNDVINGTAGRDLIYGFGGDDVIKGRGGGDLICAGDGNDTVAGGTGQDVVFGGAGDDKLRGGRSNDRLSGGDGNDLLAGRTGRDVLSGGNGNDVLRGGKGADTLSGNAGDDVLRGGDGEDDLNGGPGTNDVKQ